MRESLSARCALYLENWEVVRQALPWEDKQMAPVCAAILTGKGKPMEVSSLQTCKEILREKTGLFSNFRGVAQPAMVTLLALAADPQEKLEEALALYDALKVHFHGSQHLPFTALLLADQVRPDQYAQAAQRARRVYDLMKAEHPFLTGAEDSVFSAILALSPEGEQAIIAQVEECYKGLKPTFAVSQYTQSLSHVLALGEGSAQAKTERAVALYEALREAGCKCSRGHELSTLGVLALLPDPVEELAGEVAQVEAFLAEQKAYRGFLGLPRIQRLMHAFMLVAGDRLQMEAPALGVTVGGTMSLILAQQAALCASIAATWIMIGSTTHNG